MCGSVYVQNMQVGVVAKSSASNGPRFGFTKDVYVVQIRACDSLGGCSVMPLTVYVRDSLVLAPNRTSVCYHGHVSAL